MFNNKAIYTLAIIPTSHRQTNLSRPHIAHTTNGIRHLWFTIATQPNKHTKATAAAIM